MRKQILWTMLLALLPAGCCPCSSRPSAAPEEATTADAKTKGAKTADAKAREARIKEARIKEAEAWKQLGDYYGPPAPIEFDPPPVPPEIMGPTPMDRLPKEK